jgi:hypothetical protein
MKNFKSLRRAIRRGKAMLVPLPLQMKMIVMAKTGRGRCTHLGGRPESRPRGWQQVSSF